MRKMISLVIASFLVLLIVGCGKDNADNSVLLKEGRIIQVHVSSMPEEYKYSFTGNSATKIVDYLKNLKLSSDYPENPDVYCGMTWLITLTYTDGRKQIIYHFGNMFIKSDSTSWYKMNYEEAEQLDSLLKELV